MDEADREARETLLRIARDFAAAGAREDALALVDDLLLSVPGDAEVLALQIELRAAGTTPRRSVPPMPSPMAAQPAAPVRAAPRPAAAKPLPVNLGRTPKVALLDGDLRTIDIAPKQMFLLSLVDGMANYQDIVDLSGMHEDEAKLMLGQLLALGVITER